LSASLIYAVAPVLSLVYYGRLNGDSNARRERAEAQANAQKAKATVSADSSAYASGIGSTDVLDGEPPDADADSAIRDAESDLAAQETKLDRIGGMTRSEERRVGKECRSRGG